MRPPHRADETARERKLLGDEEVGDCARHVLAEARRTLVDGFDEDDELDDPRVAVACLLDEPGAVLAHVALDYGESADPDSHVPYLRGREVVRP